MIESKSKSKSSLTTLSIDFDFERILSNPFGSVGLRKLKASVRRTAVDLMI